MDAEMSDIDVTITAPITQNKKASSVPRLSGDEKQVLELWDHVQHLRMGIAALRAERDLVPHQNPTEDDLEKARDDSLEAGALYALHSAVTDAVLVASPILQAIHGGEKADPIERCINIIHPHSYLPDSCRTPWTLSFPLFLNCSGKFRFMLNLDPSADGGIAISSQFLRSATRCRCPWPDKQSPLKKR